MSNGYETLQLVAVGLLTTGLACRRRYPSMVWGTVAAALVIVGVAHGPSDSDAIQPLAPVLRSPLLVVHVLLVVVAYALLAVLWVNALLALTRRGEEALQRHALLTRRLLLPAVSFLAAGIFVGAVWANLSWGRYWGWDPKEVWALITLMLYALPLHSALLPAFRRPHVLHVFMALAFLAVLATYFGVNYLLGGMHSYAG
jgi:ABC-type transport system involved in cytochrome c biogenesis permease subunit